MSSPGSLAPLLEAYFTDRLIRQRRASPHTVAAYRDTFRLLLRFAELRLHKPPSALHLADLDVSFTCAFLDQLEQDRGCSARTRNVRLAAIRSFFKYVALCEPAHAALAQRIQAIPNKRYERRMIPSLTRIEKDALLAAPDRATSEGRRDHALLLIASQAGLRVSELTALRCQDVVLGTGAHVRCLGKGRKERCTPLTKHAAAILSAWLRERAATSSTPLFPNARGQALSRDGVAYILRKHVVQAEKTCPSLGGKRVSPHVLRHTAAVHLLQAGVDITVIALWLGHEQCETTRGYLDADLAFKERILEKAALSTDSPIGRYRPPDHLLSFLNGL